MDAHPCHLPFFSSQLVISVGMGPRDPREGLALLCRAYEAHAGHAGVLALLAQHCLVRDDAARACTLATAALEAADSDAGRSHALSILGRTHHAAGNLREAYSCYQQVQDSHTSHQPPSYM